jgi:hypothetical protein
MDANKCLIIEIERMYEDVPEAPWYLMHH